MCVSLLLPKQEQQSHHDNLPVFIRESGSVPEFPDTRIVLNWEKRVTKRQRLPHKELLIVLSASF